MANLDDFLRLELNGRPLQGTTSLAIPTRPTATGLQWLTTPSAVAGMAYRWTGGSLERLEITENGTSVVCSCRLDETAVQIAASPDGRLVAVACTDGSLRCWDSTASSLTLRWSLPNVHSHVVADVSVSPSSDRSHAAAASGPVRSLSLSHSGYDLAIVDNTTLRIYNAVSAQPSVLASMSDVTSAVWSSTSSPLAVGKTNGSIEIFEFSSEQLHSISHLGCPTDEQDFTCTHLEWTGETLIAGLCRVTPSDDEPDDDDEDDTAEHQAALFATTITSNTAGDWDELGDVVPFFSVPKSGRHVFFTSTLCSAQNLVVVATNVGSDVGALAQNGSKWRVVEFQEGFAASTPTNDDDEYYFPVGLQVIQLPTTGTFRLLLAATDGSLSVFSFENENNPNCFAASLSKSTAALPQAAVDVVPSKVLADSQPQLTAVSSAQPQSQTSTPEPKPSSSATPFGASSLSGTQSSFGFGGTNSTSSLSFGSPSAFGSGSASGLTFGQGTAFSFGSSAFGVTSTLGGTPTTSTQPLTQASPSGPTFGATTFGSASLSTTPSVGFGALAASQGTGIFASNQFNAFEKPNAASPMIGMPVKPLFGSNTPSKVETKEGPPPTTPSTVMETKAKENPIRPVTPPDSSPGSTNTEASTTVKMPDIGSFSVEQPSSLRICTPPTVAGKKAMKVFENMDTENSGFLPADKFEDLSDQLGEGFHGEELDAQLRRLDPSGSGKISKADFVRWYDALTQGNHDNDDDDDDDDDEGSLDSDEMAERAEEEQKARKCFGDLSSTDNDGQRFILVSSMEKLITNLGSTYGEDEFGKVLKKLKKPGDKIYESDFISWYMEWLFGDDDGSDFEDDEEDEDDDDGADGEQASRKGAKASQQDLSSMFKVDKDSWKCAVCSVRNGGDKKKCAACETVRAGFENDPDVTGISSIGTGGNAIGSSGFTFGVSTSGTIGSGGFTFGGAVASTTKKDDVSGDKAGSGFTFGSAPVGGFTFGTGVLSADSPKEGIAPGGFTFASSSSSGGLTSGGVSTFGGASNLGPTSSTDPTKPTAAASDGAKTASIPSNQSNTVSPPEMTSEPSASTAKADNEAFESAAFPPMSAKVPTPFSAAPSSSSYPPLATKAPTPFGQAGVANAPEPSPVPFSASATGASGSGALIGSSSTSPPLSSTAPTMFGVGATTSSVGSTATGSAAFPPMSAKAPTPFGGAKATTPASSSYPPLASKAPTPFGQAASANAPASSPFCTSTTGGSGSGAVFGLSSSSPLLSSTAPTPFGASATTSSVGSTATGSAAFPPMSAKAPTPFGGTKATTPASSSYPPLASKAPTPFGQAGGANASAPSPFSTSTTGTAGSAVLAVSSSSYPPLSSTAPTPFGASATTSSVGSAAAGSATLPPMSAKASTPIGGVQATTSSSLSGSAAFPPMSAKAPTPFGGAQSTAASSLSGSAAFPPMSAKAPTPFGGVQSGAQTSSSGSAAFPPMSAKAPTPFGGVQSATPSSTSGSAAFPPMSAKAPTPFGGVQSATPSSTSGSAAFPPMSAKAPTPFGGVQSKALCSASGSAAFPPMSAKAPTPFGGAQSNAPSSASGSAAFPPMSAKAPTPFGGIPSTGPSTASGSAAFPLLSAKAPTPFGGVQSTGPSSASGSAAFPPMSAKAPTPFGGVQSTGPSSASGSAAFTRKSTQASTAFDEAGGSANISRSHMSERKQSSSAVFDASPGLKTTRPLPSRSPSRVSMIEKQFMFLVDKMDKSHAKMDDMRDSAGKKCEEMERKISELVQKVQQTRMELLSCDSKLLEQKNKSIFLLSRKTDASRQINEARKLIDSYSQREGGSEDLAESQPLDSESEQSRRKFAVGARTVSDQISLLERRIDLLSSAAESPQDAAPILASTMELFTNTKKLNFSIRRVEKKIAENSTPFHSLTSGCSTYGLSPNRPKLHKRGKIRPLALQSPKTTYATTKQLKVDMVKKWDEIESALQNEANEPSKMTRLTGLSVVRTTAKQEAQVPASYRVSGRSLLLSPTKEAMPTQSAYPETNVVTVFSPPSKAKARAAWDQVSTIDQNRTNHLSLSFPGDLKEVTVANKAREKLTSMGTTPEKVQANLEVVNRDQAPRTSSRPQQSQTPERSHSDLGNPSASIKASAPAVTSKTSNAPSLFASKPKDGIESLNSTSISSFPPLSTITPTPFAMSKTSESGDKKRGEAGDSSKSESYPTKACPSEPKRGSLSSFGDMTGIGNALTFGENPSSKGPSSFPPPKPPTSVTKSSSPDYQQILASFYQKHNPSKLGEVEKTLEKYKGREVEMFAKLAAKYNVPSPLDTPAPTVSLGAPSVQSSTFGGSAPSQIPPTNTSSFGGSTPTPSPFASTGSTLSSTTASPFVLGGLAPSPSPFSTAKTVSPFGNSASTTSPFGLSATTSSPSPFISGTSFGSQQTPFGAPAPAPIPGPAAQQQTFQGRSPRDLLFSFYQQKNPSKIAEVDKLLEKYRGNEEQMFRNLAKKYQLDPSVFGLPTLPATSTFGASPGAGTTGGFGSSGGFGQPSALGGSSPFGQASGGFGQTSTLGGSTSFGSSSSTFGGNSSFGALASSSTPFGSPSGGGFGFAPSSFGTPSSSGFGGPSPFGAPRR